MSEQSNLYPVFLHLGGRSVLIVGGGPVAASKLRGLREAGAIVTVVSPEVCPAIRDAGIRLLQRPFDPADLDDAWLVVAAATPEVNQQVAALAGSRRLFVNAVDDPANATAYLGGVVRRGGVTLAISTDGAAPALAGLVREGLEAILPDDIGAWVTVARRSRREWRVRRIPIAQRRPLLLRAINRVYRRRTAAGEGR